MNLTTAPVSELPLGARNLLRKIAELKLELSQQLETIGIKHDDAIFRHGDHMLYRINIEAQYEEEKHEIAAYYYTRITPLEDILRTKYHRI